MDDSTTKRRNSNVGLAASRPTSTGTPDPRLFDRHVRGLKPRAQSTLGGLRALWRQYVPPGLRSTSRARSETSSRAYMPSFSSDDSDDDHNDQRSSNGLLSGEEKAEMFRTRSGSPRRSPSMSRRRPDGTDFPWRIRRRLFTSRLAAAALACLTFVIHCWAFSYLGTVSLEANAAPPSYRRTDAQHVSFDSPHASSTLGMGIALALGRLYSTIGVIAALAGFHAVYKQHLATLNVFFLYSLMDLLLFIVSSITLTALYLTEKYQASFKHVICERATSGEFWSGVGTTLGDSDRPTLASSLLDTDARRRFVKRDLVSALLTRRDSNIMQALPKGTQGDDTGFLKTLSYAVLGQGGFGVESCEERWTLLVALTALAMILLVCIRVGLVVATSHYWNRIVARAARRSELNYAKLESTEALLKERSSDIERTARSRPTSFSTPSSSGGPNPTTVTYDQRGHVRRGSLSATSPHSPIKSYSLPVTAIEAETTGVIRSPSLSSSIKSPMTGSSGSAAHHRSRKNRPHSLIMLLPPTFEGAPRNSPILASSVEQIEPDSKMTTKALPMLDTTRTGLGIGPVSAPVRQSSGDDTPTASKGKGRSRRRLSETVVVYAPVRMTWQEARDLGGTEAWLPAMPTKIDPLPAEEGSITPLALPRCDSPTSMAGGADRSVSPADSERTTR
ncbi:uncharacterized protein L969DRAFT_19452 [Mixia osmundae IAM 14324]|uniref:Uncharacterized protein n=1 Tax=Mixia osmundae (strain CBS 9802 / IAM 14324 / JCM 22182 / KY 12970) TaxID=764103 RepID=G7DUX3_MIXOS|nr:uncharacterized protein L969DRAFT_19452 [Mixia osmundae IAM 14324]KEI37400.1 hypothetical protein L969DRAFT_19452 [Mixia osmundae IAM 14324]GAA94383.1 hypothetical protein E5Q_01034 [Mixia osmundae IAM 14324]